MKYFIFGYLFYGFIHQIYGKDIIGAFGFFFAIQYFYMWTDDRKDIYDLWKILTKKLKNNEVAFLNFEIKKKRGAKK